MCLCAPHINIYKELKELHKMQYKYCDSLRTSQQHGSDRPYEGAGDDVPKIATINPCF